jgi:hypothetical protein
VVGIATRLTAGRYGLESRHGAIYFSLLQNAQTGSGTPPARGNYSPLRSVEVKVSAAITLLPKCIHCVDKENFTSIC